MATTPYATVPELEAFWRPLQSADETARAGTLLSMGSNYLRQIAANNGVDLDTKITADTTSMLAESVKLVVLQAVKRAMVIPTDAPPADAWSQSASPYAESMTFTNPSSDLFFKSSELALLGMYRRRGRAPRSRS